MTAPKDRASAVARDTADAHQKSRPAGDLAPRDETTNPLAGARCADCRHIEVGHDLNKAGHRTVCLTSEGPDGVRCGCKQYVPAAT